MNNIDLKRRAQVLVDLKLRVQALELLLQSIHEEAIGDLLSAAASDLPSPGEPDMPSDGPVRRRIMELLQPDDLPMLVEHPALIDYLHDELTRQKLIPKTGKRPMDHFIPLMSNDKLAATWRKDQEQPELSVEALKEALRRGIAWSMPAAAEVIELMLNSAAGTDLLNFLPSVSECPAERTEALKWIRQHAAHLIWDAALKKWVIPPTANLPAD